MILIASTRVQIPLILDNYKRVIECQFFWKFVLKHLLFETNLIYKYIKNCQTVTTIDDSAKGGLTQFWELFIMIPSGIPCAPKYLKR